MSSSRDNGYPVGSSGPRVDERSELEQLRAEVERLHRENGAARPEQQPTRHRWRGAGAVLLIALACILAPVSVASVWARGLATNTDTYVQTVAPLAKDPAVQTAVTTKLTDLVVNAVDVESIANRAAAALQQQKVLPPAVTAQLQALAVPLANGFRSFVQDRVGQNVRSQKFADRWEQANRKAHEQFVAALSGNGKAVTVQGNTVTLDLGAVLDQVKQRLVARGFGLAAKIPTVNAKFTLIEGPTVGKVQRGFNLLNTLGYWLPFVLLAMAALGLYLAPNRRRAFVGAGLGVALAMLATAVALQLLRSTYLGSVPPDALSPDAAASVFDTIVQSLREAVRALGLIALLVALGGLLTGPSTTAVTVRRWAVSASAATKIGLAELGLHMDPVTRWLAPQARVARILIAGAALALVLVYPGRTVSLVLWVTFGMLCALAVVQLLAVEPRQRVRPTAAVVTP